MSEVHGLEEREKRGREEREGQTEPVQLGCRPPPQPGRPPPATAATGVGQGEVVGRARVRPLAAREGDAGEGGGSFLRNNMLTKQVRHAVLNPSPIASTFHPINI